MADAEGRAEKPISRWANWLVFAFLVCVLLCLGSYLLVGLYNMYIYGPHARSGLKAAAARLEFEPTYTGLIGYINQEVEPEMSREQVIQILTSIGQIEVIEEGMQTEYYEIGKVSCDRLVLEFPTVKEVPLQGHIVDVSVPIEACYHSDNRLANIRYDFNESLWDPSDYPALDISESPRNK